MKESLTLTEYFGNQTREYLTTNFVTLLQGSLIALTSATAN